MTINFSRLLYPLSLLSFATLLCGCSGNLFYMPRAYESRYHTELLENKHLIHISYRSNNTLQTAYYLKPEHPLEQLWVLFGGINSLALDWYQWFYRPNTGRGFLLVDYPGYGRNEGIPRAHYIQQSCRLALHALADRLGMSEQELTARLGVLGHSLGTGPATQFARAVPVKKLILVAPFTSLSELVRYRYGWFRGSILNLINPERYPNGENISEVVRQKPPPSIDIVHGELDRVIPAAMGRKLAAAFPEGIEYHEIAGLGHQDIFSKHIDLILSIMDRP